MRAFLTVRAPLLSRTVHILCCIVNWLRLSTFIKENDDDDDDDDTSNQVKCIKAEGPKWSLTLPR